MRPARLSTFPDTAKAGRRGRLAIGGCEAPGLAAKFGTPLYVLDETTLRDRCRQYQKAFRKYYPNAQVVFAGKALATTAVFKIMAQEGLGSDVTSAAEILTAARAGLDLRLTYFHGNNKAPWELELAIKKGVGQIIVDSLTEIKLLEQLAAKAGKKVRVFLRFNPGIAPHTHPALQTGASGSKFGLGWDMIKEAVRLLKKSRRLELVGLHAHIGSQILTLEPFRHLANVMIETAAKIKKELDFTFEEINLGGGLGIAYTQQQKPPAIAGYVREVTAAVKAQCLKMRFPFPKLLIEPGRSIVGPAGLTLYTIGVIKKTPYRHWVNIDGGMADNPRPITYGAIYEAVLADDPLAKLTTEKVAIAGRFCDAGDILIKEIRLPKLKEGDILAVSATGAYNFTMASNYNRVTRPAMALVKNGRARIIVERERPEDLLRLDKA